MKQVAGILATLLILLTAVGCSFQGNTNNAVSGAPPADRSAFFDIDTVEPEPGGLDITAINRFLENYNLSVPSNLQVNTYEVEHDKERDAFIVDSGSFEIIFRLDENGEVKSALYYDGLSDADRNTVSLALVSVLASSHTDLGTLKDEAANKRLENDGYTQGLVDAIDGFGSVGIPKPSAPQVSLEDHEVEGSDMFTEDDLQMPQADAPSGTATPKNPNNPDLPEIGNFGKIPE